MEQSQVEKYWGAVASRPWLRVLETSLTQIPSKIAEIDPDLFVVWNRDRARYEVHDASVSIPAFSHVLEADELDDRLLPRIWAARWAVDPMGAADTWSLYQRLESERKIAAAANGAAREMARAARFDTWGPSVYSVLKRG